ncbi:hypothetical protein [Hwanghaeella sp. LZ110]|uniref:hypothetical protein n=1 Tax=Hwanghaeella sp. LZ110 TaxID=3402810 RepID=UPI003B6756B0
MFPDSDRAQAERRTDGLVKAIVDTKGRALGCTLAGAHAGDLLLPWIRAVQNRQKMSTLASLIAPYPTLSEVTKRTAGSYFTPSLLSEKVRNLVRIMLKCPF